MCATVCYSYFYLYTIIIFISEYGNTALHVATRRGYQNLVEILIKHGADRSFLNPQNKTAEQMIPVNYQETHKEKIERFKSIESIYNKYRKKKFKLCRFWLFSYIELVVKVTP